MSNLDHSSKCVDLEVNQLFYVRRPEAKPETLHHSLHAIIQGYADRAELIDHDHPERSLNEWSDGSYLWVQRRSVPNKFLQLIGDSESRGCFGGLTDPIDRSFALGLLGLYANLCAPEWSDLVAVRKGQLNRRPVVSLVYRSDDQIRRTLTVDASSHRLLRVTTEVYSTQSSKEPFEKIIEEISIKPSLGRSDSEFAFHPQPGMLQEDRAADLR